MIFFPFLCFLLCLIPALDDLHIGERQVKFQHLKISFSPFLKGNFSFIKGDEICVKIVH